MRRTGLIVLAVIGCFALGMGCWLVPRLFNTGVSPTAADIGFRLSLFGANATISDLEAMPDHWDFVLDQIASGKPDWLGLAPRLATATGSDPLEELHDYVGLALAHNAPLVLSISTKDRSGVLGTRFLCETGYMNNLEHGAPPGFKAQAVAAVEAISEPKLAAARDICLAELNRPAEKACSNGSCPAL
ncbi:MAG: hypothetical protein M3N05_05045 [Pseudomonadota bacterium]|nr:hypothetical protein [Pseudomonadota bacterium]